MGHLYTHNSQYLLMSVYFKVKILFNDNILIESSEKLECGPMPIMMAALPNIGGALCSTPQTLADVHC